LEIIRTAPTAVDFQPTTGKHTLFVVCTCTFIVVLLLFVVVIFIIVITTAIISMTAVAGKTSTQEISISINFIRYKNKAAINSARKFHHKLTIAKIQRITGKVSRARNQLKYILCSIKKKIQKHVTGYNNNHNSVGHVAQITGTPTSSSKRHKLLEL